ncbi:hypothetical protein GO495_13620 [Chitinophaga oryziterrae]|uniref:Uncharacterized protein n=2 Tax=Chitinophaga oryziterrae TaxID=1031224 RepID=A0A6N8J8M0_9BACT|nr:hypothetical protein [Chitinophaga oryziterrae]
MATGTLADIGQKLSNYSNVYLFEPDISNLTESLITNGFRDTVAKGYVLYDFRLDNLENGIEDKTCSFGLLINGLSRYSAEFKSGITDRHVYTGGGVRSSIF